MTAVDPALFSSLDPPRLAGARCANVREQRFEKGHRGSGVAIHAQVRQRERAEQPSPHRALVVGFVALDRPSCVVSAVAGFAGREAAQSE